MATHVLRHPMKGKCFVDLGRHAQFTVRWSKEAGSSVPKVYPVDQWDTVLSALRLEGTTCEQIAWVTPHIMIQPHPDFKGKWMATCEADFNGVKVTCSADGSTPEEARNLFWAQWNEDRRANNEPTHLAIFLRTRYRVLLPSV
tara:strand:- start:1357 stop:1785 length:429 start_codon:yes stop_codon:yes gene_type:complete